MYLDFRVLIVLNMYNVNTFININIRVENIPAQIRNFIDDGSIIIKNNYYTVHSYCSIIMIHDKHIYQYNILYKAYILPIINSNNLKNIILCLDNLTFSQSRLCLLVFV